MIQSFHEIKAWQKAHELVLLAYKYTDTFPKREDFCLIPQIRRASISVPSNIAEGFRRRSNKESLHFYSIAMGSLDEVKYQMLLARDLKYISVDEYNTFVALADEVGKTLNGWIKSQK